MSLQHWIVSVLVAAGAASCAQNAPPQEQSPKELSASAPGQTPGRTNPQQMPFSGHLSTPGRTGKQDGPVPPADAQWTILCDTIEGPSHVEDAGIMKQRLAKLSGLHDWYVIHGERESTIYYGYYRSLDNPAEKVRAEQDRARIAALTDQLQNRLVRGGVLVPVTAPDPQAPSDWNLLNTPKDAYWTIEIATFVGNAQRKQAAVQAVRELRAKGEKAYFYHGPSASSVCIGAWPRDAMQEQGTGIDKNGQSRDDAHAQDPNAPLLVLGDLAPPNMPSRVLEPGTGRPMTVMAQKRVYNDPTLAKKAEEYPYHYVNYELRGTQNGAQVFPDPSVLVIIPHEQTAATDDDWRLTGGVQPSPPGLPQEGRHSPGNTPGDDALRSIGGH